MENYQKIRFSGNLLDKPFGVDDLNFRYSTIPLLIAINVMDHFNANKPFSVKNLFFCFECSSLTVKKYLDKLISEGYIAVFDSKTDRRVRYLKPTEKLLNLMVLYGSNQHNE